MTDLTMTEQHQQYQIREDGSLGPVSWDGEPLWHPETVAEAKAANVPLFDPFAFEQIDGQLAIDTEGES